MIACSCALVVSIETNGKLSHFCVSLQVDQISADFCFTVSITRCINDKLLLL